MDKRSEMYICFVDYEKSFYRVDWRGLRQALRTMVVYCRLERKTTDRKPVYGAKGTNKNR